MVRVISILLFCGICTLVVGGRKPPIAKSGLFTSFITSIRKCKKPDLPYQTRNERSAEVDIGLFDAKHEDDGPPALRGTFTSLKLDNNLRLNITDYQEVRGKWEPIFTIAGLNCYNRIGAKLARMFKINYNLETCAVPEGAYSFYLDFNDIDHTFYSSRVYGNVLRRVVLTSKKKTVLCLEFEFQVTPED